ncbi:hypothetical protein [Streptomyces sp. NPDC048111]|uniref:hypothetical protein n=1 Tax=Streptomyces sp. NPDC048111 TaxID=3365500 RepID=UPI00371A4515
MISPAAVPTYTGDVGAVEVEVGRLRRAAQSIREHGGDVNTRFRHLHTVYRAPEAEHLFQTTQGVQDASAGFASRLETVAGALETYACEIRPLVDTLERLRGEAAAFVASVQGQGDIDPQWHHDRAKVAAHDALMHEVAATVRAFQDAEVAAADAITSVVHGTQWNLSDGSPKQDNPYGFSDEQLNGNGALPWGTPEHFSVLPFELDWHVQQFGESLGDNIKGTVTGLVDLFRPGERGQETRKGLFMTIVGAEDYLRDPDGDHPMDPIGPAGRPYARAFGKSLVGWDDWKTNPGKASATVVFNALTFASGPLGAASKAGAVGKAGEAASIAARTAGVLSRAGEVLDPIGATAKVVGTGARALPKVSELAKSIATVTRTTSETNSVHSILELKDGSKLHLSDGQFTTSKDGTRNTTPASHEPSAHQRTPAATPTHEHELVGVGGRTPDAHTHADDRSTTRANHDGGGSSERKPTHDGHAGAESHHGYEESSSGSYSGSGNGAGSGGGAGRSGGATEGHQPSPQKEWQAGDGVAGPARGQTLLYPNYRHELVGVRKGPPDSENTVILPETRDKVRQDIAGIAEGRAEFDPLTQRYKINGRRYAVEPSGRIFPVDGPGLVEMNRVEYTALKAIMQANGDMSKLEKMFSKAPQFRDNPQAVEKATEMYALYRKYYG